MWICLDYTYFPISHYIQQGLYTKNILHTAKFMLMPGAQGLLNTRVEPINKFPKPGVQPIMEPANPPFVAQLARQVCDEMAATYFYFPKTLDETIVVE